MEYPRDKWRLRNLGIQPGKEVATIDFAPIGQPWLAALAKRWCRWRLSAGLSVGEAAQGVPPHPAGAARNIRTQRKPPGQHLARLQNACSPHAS
ncbi:MAG TPA: hypothetical protein VMU94_05025 [Streptosporangiaceae bacterium]|nr:hypothetical protein [Streptosporangiaceae bacterium]